MEGNRRNESGASSRSKWTDRVFSYKFILWWSMAWALVIMALSPVANYLTPFLNPAYANQWTPDIYWRLVLYWHGGIFIPWITALAAIVCIVFGLDKVGGRSARLIKDSVLVGAFVAVPMAGVAGILNVSDHYALGIPLWAQIFAFLIGDEIAVALIVAMVNRPRAGVAGLPRVGLPYYTVFLGIVASLLSAIMGHIGGWITWFGPWPAPAAQYINSTMYPVLGYYNDTAVVTFTENVVTSHSHLMLPALMAGVVGLVAVFYGYDDKWSRGGKIVSRLGFSVMILALLASVWIYLISGVGNYATPTLFASDPNGLAADDLITGIVGFGAFFVLVALLLNSRRTTVGDGRVLIRDPLFLSIIAGWIFIYLVIPVTGYYIEFNQTFFSAAGTSFDDAFGRFHQDLGFFLLPPLITAALGLSAFGISGRYRNSVGYLFLAGETLAFLFGEIYTMFTLDPVSLYLAIFGGVLVGLGGSVGVRFLIAPRALGYYPGTGSVQAQHRLIAKGTRSQAADDHV